MKYFRYANYFYLVLSFNGKDTGLSRRGSEFNSPWNRQQAALLVSLPINYENKIMWIWYNGCAPALQAGNVGSIPSIHSNFIAMQRIIY